jgi:hypothetical protein
VSCARPHCHGEAMTGSETLTAGSTQISVLIGAPVATVAADATLHQVADALAAAGVGALVVSDGACDGGRGDRLGARHRAGARQEAGPGDDAGE